MYLEYVLILSLYFDENKENQQKTTHSDTVTVTD